MGTAKAATAGSPRAPLASRGSYEARHLPKVLLAASILKLAGTSTATVKQCVKPKPASAVAPTSTRRSSADQRPKPVAWKAAESLPSPPGSLLIDSTAPSMAWYASPPAASWGSSLSAKTNRVGSAFLSYARSKPRMVLNEMDLLAKRLMISSQLVLYSVLESKFLRASTSSATIRSPWVASKLRRFKSCQTCAVNSPLSFNLLPSWLKLQLMPVIILKLATMLRSLLASISCMSGMV
mmetsp:Transcript_32222/g.84553  ORF Transcript_32222/g.84553 Transcript_32222/m.84553 type:complete len:238 (-) Transcript_32222:1120-1833(-)